jgi:hypothetical protein
MKFLRAIRFSPKTAPLALLIVCLLAFGLLAPWLGFYWDDWAKILVSRLWGLSGYWGYYASDRPLSAWTHILFTPVLGHTPLTWHIFMVVLTWLTAAGAWWTMSRLWPKKQEPAVYAALLFAVYPAFTLHSEAVTFHQQMLQYALFFLSMGATVQAWRRPARFRLWTVVALAAMALQLSVTEYFAALELLRPVVLLVLASELALSPGKRIAAALRRYAPYLALLLAYAVWRFFLMELPNEDPYQTEMLALLFSQPAAALGRLFIWVLQDGLHVMVGVWTEAIRFDQVAGMTPFKIASVLLSLGLAGGLALYLSRLGYPQSEAEMPQRRWLRQALVLGVLGLLLGLTPAWLTGREVLGDFHANRYSLPALFGASLLLAAAVEWFGSGRLQKGLMIGALAGIAVFVQLSAANEARWAWEQQKDVYWQFYWRAPSIEPYTALVTEYEIFENQGLFSTSAAYNLLYPQPENSDTLAYWAYTLFPRFTGIDPDQLDFAYHTQFRTLEYMGEAANSVLMSYDLSQANCLWLLSPQDDAEPHLSNLVKDFLPLSNLSRIGSEPAAEGYPPADFFGPEPEHDWCYYYQKADLARQYQEWQTAADLGDQAQALGYSLSDSRSSNPHEWLPFIEAYAHTGNWNEAGGLSQTVLSQNPAYGPALCSAWQRIQSSTGSPQSADWMGRLGCAP